MLGDYVCEMYLHNITVYPYLPFIVSRCRFYFALYGTVYLLIRAVTEGQSRVPNWNITCLNEWKKKEKIWHTHRFMWNNNGINVCSHDTASVILIDLQWLFQILLFKIVYCIRCTLLLQVITVRCVATVFQNRFLGKNKTLWFAMDNPPASVPGHRPGICQGATITK